MKVNADTLEVEWSSRKLTPVTVPASKEHEVERLCTLYDRRKVYSCICVSGSTVVGFVTQGFAVDGSFWGAAQLLAADEEWIRALSNSASQGPVIHKDWLKSWVREKGDNVIMALAESVVRGSFNVPSKPFTPLTHSHPIDVELPPLPVVDATGQHWMQRVLISLEPEPLDWLSGNLTEALTTDTTTSVGWGGAGVAIK